VVGRSWLWQASTMAEMLLMEFYHPGGPEMPRRSEKRTGRYGTVDPALAAAFVLDGLDAQYRAARG
jgi:hypothetical protein